MLEPKIFYDTLIENDISFFTGVPDSLLKNICAYITDNTDDRNNIIAANEGASVGLAAGHYLATGKTALVYMQNSGQGNIINPLLSLVDPDVYKIPVLLMIGWRGEPGKKDEPQHVKQGKVTLELLETLGIPYKILPDKEEEAKEVINEAVKYMNDNSAPYAIIIRKGVFESYKLKKMIKTNYELNREEAIKVIVDNLSDEDIVVSTTGKTSRELFEYREVLGQGHSNDFLTVGSMGHSSQIALGIALSKKDRQIICLDGDGSAIMHMGSMAINGASGASNFKHIVINNGAHDSVGGQPTLGFGIDFQNIAKACCYKTVLKAETRNEISDKMKTLLNTDGPVFLEIRVNKGAREELGRPTTTPIENKISLMNLLKG